MAGFWGSLLYYLWALGFPIGVPGSTDIDRIERMTRKDGCVVRLDRWHRRYEFALSGQHIDLARIRFSYSEPRNRQRVGRFSAEPENVIYEGQFRSAGGVYDRSAGKIIKWYCGCNLSTWTGKGPTECLEGRR